MDFILPWDDEQRAQTHIGGPVKQNSDFLLSHPSHVPCSRSRSGAWDAGLRPPECLVSPGHRLGAAVPGLCGGCSPCCEPFLALMHSDIFWIDTITPGLTSALSREYLNEFIIIPFSVLTSHFGVLIIFRRLINFSCSMIWEHTMEEKPWNPFPK